MYTTTQNSISGFTDAGKLNQKFKLNQINWKHNNALKAAIDIVLAGGVLVYPTDTLYGFGVNATDMHAINKLNLLKKRRGPMSVLASDKNTVAGWMDLSTHHIQEALNILGESNTVIVPINPGVVHDTILGIGHSLGIRIPNHPFCKALSSSCTIPITTTSVNSSGEPPLEIPNDISMTFGDKIDLIIEDGRIFGDASTIYQYKDGDFIIIR